jgi:hypothetical protein
MVAMAYQEDGFLLVLAIPNKGVSSSIKNRKKNKEYYRKQQKRETRELQTQNPKLNLHVTV